MAIAAVYFQLASVALRLITKYGRPVTVRFATDAAPSDPAKPWNPGVPGFVDFHTMGVVTPADEAYVNGTTVLFTDMQVIVAAKGMPAVPDPKSIVLDGAIQYKVTKVDGIDPGPLPMAYIIFCRR
jgi:hypothetical protein